MHGAGFLLRFSRISVFREMKDLRDFVLSKRFPRREMLGELIFTIVALIQNEHCAPGGGLGALVCGKTAGEDGMRAESDIIEIGKELFVIGVSHHRANGGGCVNECVQTGGDDEPCR